MALIECSECKKQVSTNAVACPHCGNPLKATQQSNNVVYENKTVKVTCWGTGGSDAILEQLRPELDAGWEIVSTVQDYLRGGILRHVYTVILRRAKR